MDIFHSVAVHFLFLFVDFRITHFISMQPVCNANIMSIMGTLSVTLHTLFLFSFLFYVFYFGIVSVCGYLNLCGKMLFII